MFYTLCQDTVMEEDDSKMSCCILLLIYEKIHVSNLSAYTLVSCNPKEGDVIRQSSFSYFLNPSTRLRTPNCFFWLCNSAKV